MKKFIITTAIILGLGLTTFADPNGGGLFMRGETSGNRAGESGMPALPNHGQTGNQNAPIGSGVALLLTLGGAYLVTKKRNEE